MKHILAALAVAVLAQTAAFAQGKVEIAAADSPASLLAKLVGQKVELHLKNGEKFVGKVESATQTGVHLSNLSGQEFFDAVISTPDVTVVLVRMR